MTCINFSQDKLLQCTNFFLANCDFEEGTQWTEGKKEKGAIREKLRIRHNLYINLYLKISSPFTRKKISLPLMIAMDKKIYFVIEIAHH